MKTKKLDLSFWVPLQKNVFEYVQRHPLVMGSAIVRKYSKLSLVHFSQCFVYSVNRAICLPLNLVPALCIKFIATTISEWSRFAPGICNFKLLTNPNGLTCCATGNAFYLQAIYCNTRLSFTWPWHYSSTRHYSGFFY